jgi:hypothetical protein
MGRLRNEHNLRVALHARRDVRSVLAHVFSANQARQLVAAHELANCVLFGAHAQNEVERIRL